VRSTARNGRARRALTVTASVLLALVAGCGDGSDAPDDGDPGTAEVEAGDAEDSADADEADDGPLEIEPEIAALAAEPVRDLALLEAMVRLNAIHFGMGPYIRDRAQYEQIAKGCDAIVSICDEASFTGYTSQPGFARDAERFEELHAMLRQGAQDAAAAARAGDADGLFAAYTRMDVSCTGCHKRYAPLE